MLQNIKRMEVDSRRMVPEQYDTREILHIKLNDFVSISKDELISRINMFVKESERRDFNVIGAQRNGRLSPDKTEGFFRALERHQNNTLILQYMMSFMARLPQHGDFSHEPADPFQQFRNFIQFNLTLLTQEDVIDSILRSLKKQGVLRPENQIKYRLCIYRRYKELIKIVKQSKVASEENWKKIFTAMKMLSLFWFSVNNYDMTQVRKVDVFAYLLSQFLLKKH